MSDHQHQGLGSRLVAELVDGCATDAGAVLWADARATAASAVGGAPSRTFDPGGASVMAPQPTPPEDFDAQRCCALASAVFAAASNAAP